MVLREVDKQITKETNNQIIDNYSHLEEDGAINLKLDNLIHTKILDIF